MTDKETKDLIRIAVTESCEAMFDWFQKEVIVVKQDGITEITDCMLKLKEDGLSIKDYVWKRLAEKGIEFTEKK